MQSGRTLADHKVCVQWLYTKITNRNGIKREEPTMANILENADGGLIKAKLLLTRDMTTR
jgi:hypothetical protein